MIDGGEFYILHGVTVSQIGDRFAVITFRDGSEAAVARQKGKTVTDKPSAGDHSNAAEFLRRWNGIDGARPTRDDEEIVAMCESFIVK